MPACHSRIMWSGDVVAELHIQKKRPVIATVKIFNINKHFESDFRNNSNKQKTCLMW